MLGCNCSCTIRDKVLGVLSLCYNPAIAFGESVDAGGNAAQHTAARATHIFPAHNVEALGTRNVRDHVHACRHEALLAGAWQHIYAALKQPSWAILAVKLLQEERC